MRVHPLDPAALVALVNDWGTRPRQVGARDAPGPDAGQIAVADRLHAVFAAGEDPERARLVSTMLAETSVRPELVQEDGALVAGWSVPAPDDALLAAAALALREHLAVHPDRVGICADRQCADVYVDASPAGHRRFCSVTCQNRTRVAAFRERRRSAGG
ncbi:MAG TPA: CGNR zinc finger domain-containing protein [Mycobacteriales bacterium]